MKTLHCAGRAYQYADITELGIDHLPFSLQVLAENLHRHVDNKTVHPADVAWFSNWRADRYEEKEIAYRPARVLLQDFTGVPVVVDLATMRDAMAELGGDVRKINPLQAAELVIDHSVQVDKFAVDNALDLNTRLEYERNGERYQFLKWGQQAFSNFKVVPPGTGIVHQVNLEYLARVAFTGNGVIYPDTVVGTDSHTTMINGLGVLGWGVGGIEAEAAMLGQPISMLVPKVVGFKLTGVLPEGVTATDLVLRIVEMLRAHGVVGKFVEFYGEGLEALSLADRATIANMAPEYGATCGIFPVDEETLNYLRLSGRSEESIEVCRAYYEAQGLFYHAGMADKSYNETLALDLATVRPALAGSKRPQDRIDLADVKASFSKDLEGFSPNTTAKADIAGEALTNGAVVIAAITSCTNTSNPSVMLAAGLVARKARALGLDCKPWVKTSLAPGSKVVTRYLAESGLNEDLDALGFQTVGYGCTTCIGNSGPLPDDVASAIDYHDLVAASVLSGNRNFEGRVHPQVKMNYLASPPLVVAYALAGHMEVDLTRDALGTDSNGNPVYLKDVWPTQAELNEVLNTHVNRAQFVETYQSVFEGDKLWQALSADASERYTWPASTYVKKAPFLDDIDKPEPEVAAITGAYALALLGDSVTTDHISPAGSIKADSPAGHYLQEQGVAVSAFNSYGARRGNHEVMVRGTFANIRLRNKVAPGTEGGMSTHIPTGEVASIYEVAMRYQQEETPCIVIAGKEYGSGSSRDWAAKGPRLLGIRAVIAESFERIHRTNLVGMGILPLEFLSGDSAASLGLTGFERFDIEDIDAGQSAAVNITATSDNGSKTFKAKVRIDTPQEVEYYQHGGILRYVLRNLAKQN